MNTVPDSKPPRRRLFTLLLLRRCIFFLICLLTLIAAFYAEEDWRGAHIWNQYRDKWEARGEKFNELNFAPPPVPAADNFALASFFEDALIQFEFSRTNKVEHLNDPDSQDYQTRHQQAVEKVRLNPVRANEIAGIKPPQWSFWYDSTNTDLTAWQAYYRAVYVLDKKHKKPVMDEFPLPPQSQSPAQDVLSALSARNDALQKLREASLRPGSRFPVDYAGGAGSILPHLARLKSASIYLRLRSTAELALGQTNSAVADIDLISVLGNSLRTEPILISFLVRTSVNDELFSSIWEGLNRHSWSETQLKDFQEKLEGQDLTQDFLLAMRGDRAMFCGELDKMGSQSLFGPLQESIIMAQHSPDLAENFYLRTAPRGWFAISKRDIASLFQDKIIAAVQPETGRIDLDRTQSIDKDSRLHKGTAQSSILRSMLVDAYFDQSTDGDRYARGQTALNLAILACALERYWLANQHYPEHLDLLKPQFIREIPVEVTSGAPLGYQLTSNGRFKLTSSVQTLPHETPTDKNLTWSYPGN